MIYFIKEVTKSEIGDELFSPVNVAQIPRFLNPPLVPNFILYNMTGVFDVNNCEQWYLYDFKTNDQQTQQFVGHLDANFLNKYPLMSSQARSGLLGNIPNYFCKNNLKRNPYFVKPRTSISGDIYENMLYANTHRVIGNSVYLSLIPDGAIEFEVASTKLLKYKAQINDNRFLQFHRSNGVTELGYKGSALGWNLMTITDGLLALIDMVNQAFMKQFYNIHLMTTVQYMPIKVHGNLELIRLLNIMGASLYPMALSLMLPVFMYAIVLEKEERLLEFMKMNGMQMKNYWVVAFLFNFTMYLFMITIFYLFGVYYLELQFFTQTSSFILITIFIGWGIAQIALGFFYQIFLSRAHTATLLGYIVSIWTVLWGITLNIAVYPLPIELPWYVAIYPQFAMTRAIYILSYGCGYYKCYEEISEISDELAFDIFLLYFSGVGFLILSAYLNEIIPKEYGVSKNPFFCFNRLFKCKKQESTRLLSANSLDEQQFEEIDSPGIQDQSVISERNVVFNARSVDQFPLMVQDIRKVYPGRQNAKPKLAVKNVSLKVENGELFGLLGPNGAGKTTLISMLTGLYNPTQGDAWIGGFSITENLDQVQLHMGVCPQFDILWPDLTVLEHLLFYARLKGIPRSQEKSKAYQAMENTFLTPFANFKSSELSGGMKRRLSVSIALVGDPSVLFLDEPTTGLDPENKRQLWKILDNTKQNKAIVLTTHSMEEADALCSRIGIINQGELKCIGTQVQLKVQFGGGYHLNINCARQIQKDGQNFGSSRDAAQFVIDEVKQIIHEILPKATLVSEFNGNLIYQVAKENCEVSKVIHTFETKKQQIGIADWGISQSSLEDVFLNVIGENFL